MHVYLWSTFALSTSVIVIGNNFISPRLVLWTINRWSCTIMEKAPASLKCECASRCFQPGEGPSKGLLCDCENWLWNLTDGSFYSTNENSRHCCPAEKTYLQCSRSKLTPLPTPSNCLALVSKTETWSRPPRPLPSQPPMYVRHAHCGPGISTSYLKLLWVA